jgi:hypothetical protein
MDVIYDPLPQGKYIRLLEVWVDSRSHELAGKFKLISLDDCTHNYTAISYAWENPAPVSRIRFPDGRSLSLSQTLSGLFDSLRKRHDAFIVWIDALCINQKDLDERASQVRLMGKVYSSAEQVLLWLGASTQETKDAFRFIESKQTLSWPEDWDKEKDFSGLSPLFSLLERPWFQRVWVIQEVTLSDNVLIACGEDTIDFDNFRLCVFGLWKFFEGWYDEGGDDAAVRGLWCMTRLIFIRDEFQDSGAVRYEVLLQAAFHCQATDKRDMVFAFRGIADKDRLVPEPDYTASVEDVYTETAIALLCHGTSLDLLALGGIAVRKQLSELPTWTPDLRHHSYSEPFVPCDRAAWNTGGILQAPPTLVPPNQLRLQVKAFDTVEVTCATFNSYSVTDQQTAVREIFALRQRLPYEVSEELWIDMVASSLIFGLDIDDEPAGPEYREYFNEWLQWLQSSSTQEDLQKISSNKYHRTLGPRINGWKAFLTKQGFFCIGPPVVAAGDEICAVPGCRLPIIVRPDPQASVAEPLHQYILVNWCFVQGLMYGEAIAREQLIEDVLLR